MNNVDHPNHYNTGNIEAISVIEDWQCGFHLGNAIKYICRYQAKHQLVDLEKAVWYIRREIELGENDNECDIAQGGILDKCSDKECLS